MRIFTFIIILISVVSCATEGDRLFGSKDSEQLAEKQLLRVIYSSNLNGELEPCGCTMEGDFGGIHRRATEVDKQREKAPELILISGGGLLDTYSSGEQIKNNYILKGLEKLSYDAVGLQWRDLAFGTQFLNDSTLPFVSANYPADTFFRHQLIHRGKTTLEFFSLLDPAQYPLMQDKARFIQLTTSLNQQLKLSKENNHITILSTKAKESWLKEYVDVAMIDLLILPTELEEYEDPKMLDGTLALLPGTRGMRIGAVTLAVENNKLELVEHEVLELSNDIPDSPRMNNWYDSYNEDVKQYFEKMSLVKSQSNEASGAYVGQDTCKACHAPIADKLSTTRHAHAYASLERVDKAFDPECVQCHSVGFNKPGGFINNDYTPHLANVQCENCHGNAAIKSSQQHMMNPVVNKQGLVKASPEEVCQQCHNHSHSPSFKFKEYWPKIMHP